MSDPILEEIQRGEREVAELVAWGCGESPIKEQPQPESPVRGSVLWGGRTKEEVIRDIWENQEQRRASWLGWHD